MVNFSLEGKVALVTGASYGIGFALATAFARQGAKIVFNDIKQELVDKGLAAIIKRIPMVEMTAAEFRQVIDIDLNGPFIV